jgi:hypothetical protein
MAQDMEEGRKGTAGTFPDTPHPQKRMRVDDTPPTEGTVEENAAASAAAAATYDGVRNLLHVYECVEFHLW